MPRTARPARHKLFVSAVDVLAVALAVTSGNALRAFLERRVPLSAVLLTSAAQHALLVIGAALVLRPTVERNPVPHTVDRRLLHPIGIIIGCPWMSAVKATQNTLLAIARAAWGLGHLPLKSGHRMLLEGLVSVGFAASLQLVTVALTQWSAGCERLEQRHAEEKRRNADLPLAHSPLLHLAAKISTSAATVPVALAWRLSCDALVNPVFNLGTGRQHHHPAKLPLLKPLGAGCQSMLVGAAIKAVVLTAGCALAEVLLERHRAACRAAAAAAARLPPEERRTGSSLQAYAAAAGEAARAALRAVRTGAAPWAPWGTYWHGQCPLLATREAFVVHKSVIFVVAWAMLGPAHTVSRCSWASGELNRLLALQAGACVLLLVLAIIEAAASGGGGGSSQWRTEGSLVAPWRGEPLPSALAVAAQGLIRSCLSVALGMAIFDTCGSRSRAEGVGRRRARGGRFSVGFAIAGTFWSSRRSRATTGRLRLLGARRASRPLSCSPYSSRSVPPARALGPDAGRRPLPAHARTARPCSRPQVVLLIWAAHMNARRAERAAATQRAKAQRLAQLRSQKSTGERGPQPRPDAGADATHVDVRAEELEFDRVEDTKEQEDARGREIESAATAQAPTEATPLCHDPPPGLVFMRHRGLYS